MTSKEAEERIRVILEAMTWIKTPFHFGARVKGNGVDCAQLIAAVFETCGIFKADEYGFFGLMLDGEFESFDFIHGSFGEGMIP